MLDTIFHQKNTYLGSIFVCVSESSNREWEMKNGKLGGKCGTATGTGFFTGLTRLLWASNAVPVLRETLRASPNIANLLYRIRKAPEYTTILIYYLKIFIQYYTRICF
jgi:hypothetical protein